MRKTATFGFRLLCNSNAGGGMLSNREGPTKVGLSSTRVGQAITFHGSAPGTEDLKGATVTWTASGKFTAPASWSGSITIGFDLPADTGRAMAAAQCGQKFPQNTLSIGDLPLN